MARESCSMTIGADRTSRNTRRMGTGIDGMWTILVVWQNELRAWVLLTVAWKMRLRAWRMKLVLLCLILVNWVGFSTGTYRIHNSAWKHQASLR